MNLTVPFEVLQHSPAGFDYPTDSFCDLIPQYEQEMRRECLGKPLWDFLVSKLNPYPATWTEWDESVEYAIGDVVVRNLCTYISTANANSTDPLATGSSWNKFERFSQAGANKLWTLYLRQIMAYKVFVASLTTATYRSGAGGMTINVGDGTGVRAVNKTEFLTNLTQYNGIIELTTRNMNEWLRDNYEAEELPLPACVGNCDVPSNRSRRIAFR